MALHLPNGGAPCGEVAEFYREAFRHLLAEGIPFLIGGGYAVEIYTGIQRRTKDIDAFVLPEDVHRAVEVLAAAGFEAEMVFDHWLAKVRRNDELIDIIFSGSNGIGQVDRLWFEHAVPQRILDLPLALCPPEEMIWQKAFVMARDRFDVADVSHLLRSCGPRLQWQRLWARFGPHWQILLTHLILFSYIYPGHREIIPHWLVSELMRRLETSWQPASADEARLCRGTMLGLADFQIAVTQWGYEDGRPITGPATTPPAETAEP